MERREASCVPQLLKRGATYPRLTQREDAVPAPPALSPRALTARGSVRGNGAQRAPAARVVWWGWWLGVGAFCLFLRNWFREREEVSGCSDPSFFLRVWWSLL